MENETITINGHLYFRKEYIKRLSDFTGKKYQEKVRDVDLVKDTYSIPFDLFGKFINGIKDILYV